jgi:hypothetical protein
MLGVGVGEVISGVVLGTILALAIPMSIKNRLAAIKL